MDMPSIDDVKAAAEFVLREDVDLNRYENMRDFCESATTLAKSFSAILSAPGMSAERLAEIQRSNTAAEGSCSTSCDTSTHVDKYCSACVATEEAHSHRGELLAEVLRLRAISGVDRRVSTLGTAVSDSVPQPDGTHLVKVELPISKRHCKTCRHWGSLISGSDSQTFKAKCESPHLAASRTGETNNRAGAVPIAHREGTVFGEQVGARGIWTGPDFGCVHWECQQ